MNRFQQSLAVLSVGLCLPAASVQADAIDGSWCFQGRHLEIEGPQIMTPGGRRMTGNYDRHGFVYEAPADEIEAGAVVYMILLDEETMEFRVGSEEARPDVWRRCVAPTS